MGFLYDIFLSISCYKSYDTYKDFWRLRRLYKRKKKGFVCDLDITLQDAVFSEKGVEKYRIPLENGHDGIYCLYDFKKYKRYMVKDAKYDLLSCDDLKPIRSCTMKEFIVLYGHIL